MSSAEEPDGPGFWALTRYADVDACGRDPKTFSSEPTIMIADPEASGIAFGDKKMMLMMDPPNHTQFRKLVSREFTKGEFRREREVSRVTALCALGQEDAAKRVAKRYLAKDSSSVHAQRISQSCAGDE